jgi:4a-hydroxytetrahydrobiopterin dehydratase
MTATPAKLTNFEVESVLTQLPGWTVVAGKLHREYRFPDFGKAFGFMKTAAPAIEKMDITRNGSTPTTVSWST